MIEVLNNIKVTKSTNDNEFILIDEELISPIIQPENLQGYSKQLAFTLTSVLKINENL